MPCTAMPDSGNNRLLLQYRNISSVEPDARIIFRDDFFKSRPYPGQSPGPSDVTLPEQEREGFLEMRYPICSAR
jgi:hypothetical protein